MNLYIETSRCILRELQLTDAADMYTLDSDPEVHRFLGNKPIQRLQDAMQVIDFVRKQYVENGIGRWALLHKERGDFMGWCGLKLVTEPVNGHVLFHDLGYRLIPRFWGQGYASEAGAAALDYGFDRLKLDSIYAAAHTGNQASNRVLEKLGFARNGSFDCDDHRCYWYEIHKQGSAAALPVQPG